MNYQTVLSLSAIMALGLALPASSASAQQKTLKDQLVGSWTLVSLDNVKDGKKQPAFGPNPKGTLILDASGRYSMMHVPATRSKFKSPNRLEATGEESMAVMRASFATFGTWTVSEADKTITQRVEVSLIPNADGTESKRINVSVAGDELKWTTPGPSTGGDNESVYRRAK